MVFQENDAEPSATLPDPRESAVVEWLTETPRAFRFAVGPQGLLLGSATGCDIRLGFPNPPVLAFLRYEQGQLWLRLLAPQVALLVEEQIAPAETPLLMGATFSLGGQKARVLYVAPPQPAEAPLAHAPATVLAAEPPPSPPIAPFADPRTPLWAPIVDQLREEAEKFHARQQELASLSQELENQAQAIDRWHSHLSTEESKLQERLSQLEQKEKELVSRIAAAPEVVTPEAISETIAPETRAALNAAPLRTLPADANLNFAELFFPQPTETVTRFPVEALALDSQQAEPPPVTEVPSSESFASVSEPEFDASAGWPEDDSWDFLHGGTEPTPPSQESTAPEAPIDSAPFLATAALPETYPVEVPEAPTELVAVAETAPEILPLESTESSLPRSPGAPAPSVPSPPEAAVVHVASPSPKQESAEAKPANESTERPVATLPTGHPAPVRKMPSSASTLASPPSAAWRAPASFEDWFLGQYLNLDAQEFERLTSAKAPAGQTATGTGNLFAHWLQNGWIRQETVTGLANLAQAEGLPLEHWLEQKHPGFTGWLEGTATSPARLIVGPYLVFEGDARVDSYLEAVHSATGQMAALLAKPALAKPPGNDSPPTKDQAPQAFFWEALIHLEHENTTPLTGLLDQEPRTFAVWEIPAGRPVLQLTRISPALGIWYRLFLQAALGVRALHQTGLHHGAIGDESFVLQPGGLLTFHQVSRSQTTDLASGRSRNLPKDLNDLGSLGWLWLEKIFGERERSDWKKWLPATLWELLERLDTASGTFPKIATVEELAHELDRLGLQIRANPFTWASFLDRQFPGRQHQPSETRKISA